MTTPPPPKALTPEEMEEVNELFVLPLTVMNNKYLIGFDLGREDKSAMVFMRNAFDRKWYNPLRWIIRKEEPLKVVKFHTL